MKYDEFRKLIDRSFLEEWIDSIPEKFSEIPDTKDGHILASLICQMSISAALQKHGLLKEENPEHVNSDDLSMELVARLWPLFPIGFKSDFGKELWEKVQYVDWENNDSVHHNLSVPAQRDIACDMIKDRLKEFPLLTGSDLDSILKRTQTYRSLIPFFSYREQQIFEILSIDKIMHFQLQVLRFQMQGEARLKTPGIFNAELFDGVAGSEFEFIRKNSTGTLGLILAHRSQFSCPPQTSHNKMVDSIREEGARNNDLLNIPSLPKGINPDEVDKFFRKLTFIASYEAAYNLLLSESFLKIATGRDAQSRKTSGFHFWYDLQTPSGKQISIMYLEWIGRFVTENLTKWNNEEHAAFIGNSPVCLFLEAVHLGQLPEIELEVIRDPGIRPPPEPVLKTEKVQMEPVIMNRQESGEYKKERTIRVFISSTFRDMQEERNELVKQVFPQLRKLCEQRGLAWAEIDLRWGITEEQAEHGDVLPICLREIERCRPFFIGLLGERYGWIPDQIPNELIESYTYLKHTKGSSLTEMEIVHGAMNSPVMNSIAYFYFRDPAYIETLPPEIRYDFVESDTNRQEKLCQLKDRIRNSGLALKENYRNPKDLGRLVMEDLTAAINREFPSTNMPDIFQRITEEHEAFARSRRSVYIGRQEYFQRLDQHVTQFGPLLVILGSSGSGKSALLANWASLYREQHPEALVIMHFIGSGSESAGWELMLGRIMSELRCHSNIEEDIPKDSKELSAAFPKWLRNASAGLAAPYTKIILLLDGLNQLEDRDGALDLVWLPVEFTENMSVILSTLPGRALEELNRRGVPSMTVEPLEPTERRQLIIEYLKQFCKQLSPSLVNRIASAPQATNPLYLRSVLDELRIFGIHEKLEERIGYYLEAGLIEDLFDRILTRCEEDYNINYPDLVCTTMSLIWASRYGLSESEILDMLGTNGTPLPRAFWSPLFLSVESSLIIRSGLITFSHDYMRKAVGTRYLSEIGKRLAMHKRIADYFEKRDIDLRLLDELPWQLCKAADWDCLVERLKVPKFFLSVCKHDNYSLRTYWKKIEDNSAYQMEKVYAEVIEHPEEHPEIINELARMMLQKGQLEIALKLFNSEVSRYEISGDNYNLASSLQNSALAFTNLGKIEQGLERMRKAEVIWRKLGYMRGLQGTLGNIAINLREQGRIDEAKKLLLEQEELARELKDRPVLAINLNNQALICKDQGDFAGAFDKFHQSELLYRELGDRDGLQTTYGNQANLHMIHGKDNSALELLKKQEQICRESSILIGLMSSLCNQAIVLRHKGDIDNSWSILEEHEKLCRKTGYQKGLVLNLINKAHILKIWRKFDEAIKTYRDAEQISRQIGNLHGIVVALSNQAIILEDKMDLEAALQLRNEQEQICRNLGNPNELAQCLAKKAELLGIPLGRPREAKSIIDEAEQIATQLGIESLLKEIKSIKMQINLASFF